MINSVTLYVWGGGPGNSDKWVPAVVDAPLVLYIGPDGQAHLRGPRPIVGELAQVTAEGWLLSHPPVGEPRCFLEAGRLCVARKDFTVQGNRIIASQYWLQNRGAARLIADYEW
jgi:hypothetical protein